MKLNYTKIAFNIMISIIITILFIATEQFYRAYNDILVYNITLKAIAEQFLLNYLIISIINKRAIMITYSILVLLVWFQFLHFSYFGTWIFPLEYYLFFTKFQETCDTFITVSEIMLVPSILCLFLIISIFITLNYSESKRLKVKFLSTFLILFIIFLPLRVYIKDSKKGHRPNVEYYPIKNTFTTSAYLLGRILPKKISGKSGLEKDTVPTPNINTITPNINIIMIMGESLNRNFMSLYDYKEKTTPYLDSLKSKENFIFKKAIASGVVTDVAIPTFFNMIKEPDGVPQIITTNTCLFKMAKSNGFFNVLLQCTIPRPIIPT